MTDKPRRVLTPPKTAQAKRSSRPARPAEPEIRIAMTPAGRETLDAIHEELGVGPRRSAARRLPSRDSGPEIVIEQATAGRDTLAAIAEELRAEPRGALTALQPSPHSEPTEVFEVLTFLVKHPEPSALLSEDSRRSFVAARVLQRLPGKSMQRVARIDVSPWVERETAILRVWLLVEPSE